MMYPGRPPRRVLVHPARVVIFVDFEDPEQLSTFERELGRRGSPEVMAFWWAPDDKGRRYKRFGYYGFCVDPARVKEFREALTALQEAGIQLEELSSKPEAEGFAPRGANTDSEIHTEPYKRINKHDIKHSVDGRKTSGAEEQEAEA